MLLILEIVLTVKAWKNGWKALALVPDALALFIGFLIGASAPPGSSNDTVLVLGFFLDLLAVAVLGFMSVRAPRTAANATAPAASLKSAGRVAQAAPVCKVNEGAGIPETAARA